MITDSTPTAALFIVPLQLLLFLLMLVFILLSTFPVVGLITDNLIFNKKDLTDQPRPQIIKQID